MKESKLTVAVVGLVCLGLLAYLVCFSVRVDEMAVLYRFNNVKAVVRPSLGPMAETPLRLPPGAEDAEIKRRAGLFLKWPYPIDKVKKYSQRIHTLEGPLTQQQLPDSNQIIPRVYATWRVVDPVAFENSLRSIRSTAERRLKNVIGNETAVVFGTHTLGDVVNTDREELEFDQIEEEILTGVRRSLESEEKSYGIEVCSLGIMWVTLPEETTQAVFRRMQKERQRIAEELRSAGQRMKREKVAEAREERDKIIAEANATATQIRARAEAEAAEYYDTFAKNQALSIFLRRLEAIRRIAASASGENQPLTLVLSTKSEPFVAFEEGIGQGQLEKLTPGKMDELLQTTEEAFSSTAEK